MNWPGVFVMKEAPGMRGYPRKSDTAFICVKKSNLVISDLLPPGAKKRGRPHTASLGVAGKST
eukprot:scaffold280753_cov24-Tisochrysis_lutea.AAC.1